MQLTDGLSELAHLIDAVARGETRVLVERAGAPAVAVISARDLVWLEQAERRWDEGTKALERFSAAFADVPTEEAEAEVARIITDIRRQDAEEKDRERRSA
jgi:prevent-host-death family protein